MTTPDPTRRNRNLIGIAAIVLLILFFILEFFRYINFLEWLVLVVITFLVANFVLRRMRKAQLTRANSVAESIQEPACMATTFFSRLPHLRTNGHSKN